VYDFGMVFEDLTTVVERLEVPPTCEAIAELLAMLSRLEAKLAAAVDEVNHSGEWEIEGATSMTSWLRWAGTMTGGAAKAMVTVAERVAQLPVTAAAWESGELSSGQVRVIPPRSRAGASSCSPNTKATSCPRSSR